jgi:wyosine [tRNA(Phe)-imidazoG37] synthetase (radical SAM superfamily)
MSKIIFTKGASTFTFSKGRKFIIDDPDQVNVPVDYSDGRQLYAYNKGVAEKFWNLVYDKLSATDYSNFRTWLLTTVVGPTNTFTMTDENGATHTVRLMDTKNPLAADGEDATGFLYSGTIHLREEII